MKKSLYLASLLTSLSTLVFSQTNVFPTNGNVGIGNTSPSAAALEILRLPGGDATLPLFSALKNDNSTFSTGTDFNIFKVDHSYNTKSTSYYFNTKWADAFKLSGTNGTSNFSAILGETGLKLSGTSASTNFQLGKITASGKIANSKHGLYSSQDFILEGKSLGINTNNVQRMSISNAGLLGITTGNLTLGLDGALNIKNVSNVDILTLNNAGNLTIGSNLDIKGNQITLNSGNTTSFNRALMIGQHNQSTTPIERVLIINPRQGWGPTAYATNNDFSLGTLINSRLFVSSYIGTWDKPPFLNETILAQFDGNVLAKRLYVDGLIQCEALKVKMSEDWVWADYVFADDYKLNDLNAVEAYIKTNKHLPNIPSAAEIEKDGVDVAQIQVLQMEKIEELTLYLIEMKKEIEGLKKANEELHTLLENK